MLDDATLQITRSRSLNSCVDQTFSARHALEGRKMSLHKVQGNKTQSPMKIKLARSNSSQKSLRNETSSNHIHLIRLKRRKRSSRRSASNTPTLDLFSHTKKTNPSLQKTSSSICPKQHVIMEKLTVDPFAPDMTIKKKLLCGNGFSIPVGMAESTTDDVSV
jgi:hypothetical protein